MDRFFPHLERLVCDLERLAAAPREEALAGFALLVDNLPQARKEVEDLLDDVQKEKHIG